MKDVRVLNKRQYTSIIFVDMPQQHYLAFPSLYGDEKHNNSFDVCHELFSSMEILQRESRTMMVKNDSEPGDFGASYVKRDLMRTAWMYMNGTPNNGIGGSPKEKSQSIPENAAGELEATITTDTLVFKMHPQIKNLRYVHGQFIGVGMQVRVPKLNHSPAHLGNNGV
jgi:hypothetical protein